MFGTEADFELYYIVLQHYKTMVFKAGNKGTKLGKCSRASREPNQPHKGVKIAPQYMLRLSQCVIRLLRPSGRDQAVLRMLTLGSG
jgi:hypothetical protein